MNETPSATGNPVLPIYAADPDAHIVGDRYYIYATNAGFYPDREAFTSGDSPTTGYGFAAWSSPDLRTWRDEGLILRFADVAWAKDLPMHGRRASPSAMGGTSSTSAPTATSAWPLPTRPSDRSSTPWASP